MFFKKIKYYTELIRLNNPSGFFLLLWPTLWSLVLSNKKIPNLLTIVIFVIETFLLRSAGCVINDLIDRNIDVYISRTRYRPLASGKISSNEAICIFLLLIILAFLISLKFGICVIYLSLFTLVLIIIYPFTKRYIYVPQLFLGFVFSFSIPITFQTQNVNIFSLKCLLLFLANTCWTTSYDTQYSLMDHKEDYLLGIKSISLCSGNNCNLVIFILQLLTFLILVLLGYYEGFKFIYYVFIFLIILIFKLQFDIIRKYSYYYLAFKINNLIGLIILFGIIYGIK